MVFSSTVTQNRDSSGTFDLELYVVKKHFLVTIR